MKRGVCILGLFLIILFSLSVVADHYVYTGFQILPVRHLGKLAQAKPQTPPSQSAEQRPASVQFSAPSAVTQLKELPKPRAEKATMASGGQALPVSGGDATKLAQKVGDIRKKAMEAAKKKADACLNDCKKEQDKCVKQVESDHEYCTSAAYVKLYECSEECEKESDDNTKAACKFFKCSMSYNKKLEECNDKLSAAQCTCGTVFTSCTKKKCSGSGFPF